GAGRAVLLQIRGQGAPHIWWQRQPILASTLASDQNFTTTPVHVSQAQVNHLTGSQTQPGQKQQGCVITSPRRAAPVTTLQQLLHLLGFQKLGKLRQTPSSHCGNRRRQ